MLSAPRDWFKWSLSSGAPTGSPGLLEPHTERITRLTIHHAASKRESHARAVRSERPFRRVPWHVTLRCILAALKRKKDFKKNKKTSGRTWRRLLSSAVHTAKAPGINCNGLGRLLLEDCHEEWGRRILSQLRKGVKYTHTQYILYIFFNLYM